MLFAGEKCLYPFWFTRGSVVGWGTTLEAGRPRVRSRWDHYNFSIDLILPAAPCIAFDSASNINQYHESSCGKGRPVPKADNLTDSLDSVGDSTSHQLMGLHNLFTVAFCANTPVCSNNATEWFVRYAAGTTVCSFLAWLWRKKLQVKWTLASPV